jgi:hypothetical protein
MIDKPQNITPAQLDVVVMPNGEIICLGETVGWWKTHNKYLNEEVDVKELNGKCDLHLLFKSLRQLLEEGQKNEK